MRKLLLQTTIEGDDDDWNINRFSRLRTFLTGLRDENGLPAFLVYARNRTRAGEPDPVLSRLHESEVDQLWLLAVDTGGGLLPPGSAGTAPLPPPPGGAVRVSAQVSRRHARLPPRRRRLDGDPGPHGTRKFDL